MKQALANLAASPQRPSWRGFLCLLSCMLLAACGGQGGASTGIVTGPDPALTSQGQSSSVAGHAPAVLAGAYGQTQTKLGADFVSFVWADRQTAPDPVTHWMALYMPPSKDPKYYPPVLFQGVVSPQVQGAASVALTWFYAQDQLRSATASMTAASSESYQIALPGTNLEQTVTELQFNATSLATSADIDMDWTGTWADAGTGGSIKTDASLRIQNGKANTDFGNCKLALNLEKDGLVAPYFLATLNVSSLTGKVCARSPSANSSISLSGIAFIHDTVLGSATVKRLEIMLADTKGSGISFRSDVR